MSKTTNKFVPEVRARAIRIVLDHEADYPSRWATVVSIAEKIGCSPPTLHEWVKKAEVDSGKRVGVTSDIAEKLKALERENRELRQANEILRKASGCFAQAVEPICNVLPIAPSTYHDRVRQRGYPSRLSARAQRDLMLKPEA